MKFAKISFPILLLIAVCILPFISNNFIIRFATDILIFAILSSSWNLIGGYTGYASFGNVVFFGLGAYMTAVFMGEPGLGFIPSMLLSGLLCSVFAFLAGLPVLRLRGHYFAIATLGMAEGIKALVQNLDITEGNSGMYLPPPDMEVRTSYILFFFIAMGVLALLLLLTKYILKRRFGYGMVAIREDEESAASLGINTTLIKSAAFSLSALFTALAGSLFAYQQGFIKPESVFNVLITVKMIVMAVFGGIATIFGPLIGAVTIEVISEFLSNYFLVAHTLFFGVIIILMILFTPKGLLKTFGSKDKFGLSALLKNIREHKV